MADYYHKKDITSIVFEGGAIGDPASINNHEAGIWKLLEANNFIQKSDIPRRILNNLEEMKNFSKNVKGKYEVKYIHKIKHNDEFIMHPNINNFEKVKKNEKNEKDNNGLINTTYSGYILMPLIKKKALKDFIISKKN